MTQLATSGITELIRKLDAAVDLPTHAAITMRVKQVLEDLIARGVLELPSSLTQARKEGYARRLLHRDIERGYTAVVMTWGPGQRTALHDHAGIWCVEGVVKGRMNVTQYDLVEERSGTFRFAEQDTLTASVGSAGCLIPPFEYHVLANALDTPSITLHVYGGELTHCHAFEPRPDGRYIRIEKTLTYDA